MTRARPISRFYQEGPLLTPPLAPRTLGGDADGDDARGGNLRDPLEELSSDGDEGFSATDSDYDTEYENGDRRWFGNRLTTGS